MHSSILIQESCDKAEYEENRNSAQRIVNAMMEVVDKQLRNFHVDVEHGETGTTSKGTK